MSGTALLVGLAAAALALGGNEKKIEQALNRLTYGPRPGDAAEVRRMGLKKWIEAQLHPERIQENPALEAKLRPLET